MNVTRCLALGLLGTVFAVGCAGGPAPLQALDRPIELERFMGPWYVVAHIPIDLPFASEANAYEGVETYALLPNGEIDIVYEYRDGSFEAPLESLPQRGWVHDPTNRTEWRVQFLWPFRSAYLIAWVDDDYRRAIVGVPSRDYAWILSRDAVVEDAELDALSGRLENLGYDLAGLRRVPQRPASNAPASP